MRPMRPMRTPRCDKSGRRNRQPQQTLRPHAGGRSTVARHPARQHVRLARPQRRRKKHDDQNADGNAFHHRRPCPRLGTRRCNGFDADQTAGRLRARNASHLSLDAGARSDRLLPLVLPAVERRNVPGVGRTVRPRPGEKSQASLERDARQTVVACGRGARAGVAVVGRAVGRLGPDCARSFWTACCGPSAIAARRC